MKILVTGASGFVGTTLVSALSHAGHSVQPFSFTHLVEGKSNGPIPPADVCIHLGARVHVMRDANADPLAEYRKVNTSGTLTLARQAAMAGIRRFLFISSIKVNGEMTAPGKPFSVDDTPAPVDPYGVSKMEAEIGLKRIAEETGMEAVVIRPPLVYGPGVKANFEVMMRWLQRGLPLPFGAIRNRRSLVALDNLLNLIGVCLHHPAAANRTFLVSDGEDLSMPQLLRLMGDALGKPARLIPVPEQVLQTGARLLGRPDLAQRLCCSLQVDIASTRRLLEWNPPVSVDEGIRRTAQHWIAAANC